MSYQTKIKIQGHQGICFVDPLNSDIYRDHIEYEFNEISYTELTKVIRKILPIIKIGAAIFDLPDGRFFSILFKYDPLFNDWLLAQSDLNNVEFNKSNALFDISINIINNHA